ncbi:DUF488 domain-containing protein [Dysgonomonas sp. ZJ709]|uniref:DUF488 domain-containing protein n=1 Tax=Dysgonomonas sp. ZJ709 TaxID=2709797 RepID=UPI0013EDD24B|nr:DUF488 family protein [Dysgonomonas sp. ZJ709]
MMKIQLKRVYDDFDENDGYRVLVDRLWPRGISKARLHYDLWAKDITPSSKLRIWVHEDMEGRWDDFAMAYRKELSQSSAVHKFTEQIKQYDKVTLLYASRETKHNHAIILKGYLEKRLSE